MHLISCHIENFGKLHDFRMDFDPGVEIILQDNGWGKSTLAAFIRVMFFGFDGNAKHNALENERKRFAPWQGGPYGGSLDFALRGRNYRIERKFGARPSGDEFRLFDARTNLPSRDFTDNIGEEIFGIDADSFERTVFVAQQDCGTEATSGIQAQIAGVADQTADMGNYEIVDDALKKELLQLTPDRKTGKLRRLEDQLAQLRESLRRQDSVQAELTALSADQRRLLAETARLQETQRGIRQRMNRLSEWQSRRAQPAQDQALGAALRTRRDEAARELKEAEAARSVPAHAATLAAALGALALAAAVALAWWRRPAAGSLVFALCCLLPAAGAAALAAAFLLRRSRKAQQEHRARRRARLAEVEEEFARFEADLAARGEEPSQDARPEAEGVTMEALHADFDRLQDRLAYQNERAARLRQQIAGAEDALEQLNAAEEEYRALAAEEMALRHRYEILQKTRESLEQARINFSQRYMEPIQQAFDRYYALLDADATDPARRTYELDANLNIQVREAGGSRDTGFLSEGTQDLVGLCRRMAMIDAMYGAERPFLLFDDPFVNLDGPRLEGARRFVRALSRDYQVIYFTCHESRRV